MTLNFLWRQAITSTMPVKLCQPHYGWMERNLPLLNIEAWIYGKHWPCVTQLFHARNPVSMEVTVVIVLNVIKQILHPFHCCDLVYAATYNELLNVPLQGTAYLASTRRLQYTATTYQAFGMIRPHHSCKSSLQLLWSTVKAENAEASVSWYVRSDLKLYKPATLEWEWTTI